MNAISKIKILGLNFFNGKVKDVIEYLKYGGLLVVPSAPALVKINEDSFYYECLHHADIIIADSGFMSLLWNFRKKQKINRISGLEFLKAFLEDEDIKKSTDLFLVDPNVEESAANMAYLTESGFVTSDQMSYVAPMYKQGKITDEKLLARLEVVQPKYIVINLSGGVQEKLGSYLKRHLSYKPAIICTGAAIAFLTGKQAQIPMWVDKLYLGWLMRCLEKPSVFVPRYYSAIKLARMMINNQSFSVK